MANYGSRNWNLEAFPDQEFITTLIARTQFNLVTLLAVVMWAIRSLASQCLTFLGCLNVMLTENVVTEILAQSFWEAEPKSSMITGRDQDYRGLASVIFPDCGQAK
jgi:hypothetical protein